MWRISIPLSVLMAGLSCGGEQGTTGPGALPALSVTAWGPGQGTAGTRVLLPGTLIEVTGSGFLAPEAGSQRLHFVGAAGGNSVSVSLSATWRSETLVDAHIDAAQLAALCPQSAVFSGKLRLERESAGGSESDSIEVAAQVQSAESLAPSITAVGPGSVTLGGEVVATGSGFLQGDLGSGDVGEGTSFLVLDGQYAADDPPLIRPVSGLWIPGHSEDRLSLRFSLTADLLGIRPGAFSGTVSVLNQLASGATTQSGAVQTTLRIEPSSIEQVMPTLVRRGQKVRVLGSGLLPSDPELQATTLILLEGDFQPAHGPPVSLSGDKALVLFPDEFQGNMEMDYVLRVTQGLEGKPEGLGVTPGLFTGTVSPLLLSSQDFVEGLGLDVQMTVAPQLQMIYLKYLPGFDQALDLFGLGLLKAHIQQRILEVTARDYAGINVQFTQEVPAEFVEYAIVEVGGHDPNNQNLFGLDNTEGKDTGNIRFNDVVGGKNAETAEQGYFSYGGIFAESFLALSPSISGNLPLASPRFDDIFAAFIPADPFNGKPVKAGEYPGGPRAAQIGEAVRVLGNLIGNTITHEVGHTLGLAAIEGQFHDVGDNLGWIMDAGSARPFEERAEIDGQGPAVFAPFDRSYLEGILPVE